MRAFKADTCFECSFSVNSPFYVPGKTAQRTVLPGGELLQTLLVSLDHLLDHLAADGTGLTGGQVTVVTVSQVHANFLSSLHLELLHSLLSLGNVDLIVSHIFSLLLLAYIFVRLAFLERCTFLRKHFSFRKHSFAEKKRNMIAFFRKISQLLEK